ncbi:hypothetical protein [Vallitalea sp.]|jgi:hypothetical protein|uniref:hypothetical protein n=1 Tax=Vallitalea sp. TaxID=1882829 RepID=UPI0025EE8DA3|nr:hypothetical protein [Vallitalea sp.]MCT4688904.1 hypothetical protein [Vallitalea sp.]
MKKFKVLLVALTFILATQISYAKDLNTNTIGLQKELAPIIDKTVTVYEPFLISLIYLVVANQKLRSTGEPTIL